MVAIFISHYNASGGAVFTPNWGEITSAILCQCSASISHSVQTGSSATCISAITEGVVASDAHVLKGILQDLIAQAMGAGADTSAYLRVLASIAEAFSVSDQIPYLSAHYLTPVSEAISASDLVDAFKYIAYILATISDSCMLTGTAQGMLNAMTTALQRMSANDNTHAAIQFVAAFMSEIQAFMWRAKNETNNDM